MRQLDLHQTEGEIVKIQTRAEKKLKNFKSYLEIFSLQRTLSYDIFLYRFTELRTLQLNDELLAFLEFYPIVQRSTKRKVKSKNCATSLERSLQTLQSLKRSYEKNFLVSF